MKGAFFIKNALKTPPIVTKLSKLIRRIPQNHIKQKLLQEQLRNYSSGHTGEKSLDYFYRYLPKTNMNLLHGIRILHDHYYFQMDTLILTPNFITILEIKNLAGHLYFDDKFSQLIRTYNGQKEAFSNPIEQVKRQSYHLKEILLQQKYSPIPIESLVVMTHPHAIIEASPTYKETYEKVIKSTSLQQKFHEFSQKHPQTIFLPKQIKKLSKFFIKVNSSFDPDICEFFQIDKKDLLTGVLCPLCDQSIMNYKRGTWHCLPCNYSSKTAHIKALQDYAYLFSTQISNRDCMKYLHLKTSDQTNHLLRSLKLPTTGSTKSRKYNLEPLLEKTT
ncbi:nuclease-related domain-containing protein [Fictibacillus sp. b24]|uniref:nuclease-related domain-containing protein n=1 Tax=Fictibacillus sp. b24 TaxID=3055863 RepID=UPI0025A0E73F|nr:nuclease-related domain-containing protein [Fictibacillus sp. b24]MDM5317928.1 nuclease-related domain-containing protein [Fictibacillus sp. b24]